MSEGEERSVRHCGSDARESDNCDLERILMRYMPTEDPRDVFSRDFADTARSPESGERLVEFFGSGFGPTSLLDVAAYECATLDALTRVLYGLNAMQINMSMGSLAQRVDDRLGRADRRRVQDILFALARCLQENTEHKLCTIASAVRVRWHGRRVRLDYLFLWLCLPNTEMEIEDVRFDRDTCPISGHKCVDPRHRRKLHPKAPPKRAEAPYMQTVPINCQPPPALTQKDFPDLKRPPHFEEYSLANMSMPEVDLTERTARYERAVATARAFANAGALAT